MTRNLAGSSNHREGRRAKSSSWLLRASNLAIAGGFALSGVAAAAQTDSTVEQPVLSDGSAERNDVSSDRGAIIVTARRVEERLQDIPASVSVIDADQAAGMSSLADIQSLVSGVTFQTLGPVPVIGIRGFGNRSQAGNPSQAAVGIFQDGVFVAPTLATLINRTDTARIEVAKGPQSTLYGRSSFIGAINIVSSDPEPRFAGYVDAGYGFSATDGDDLWRIQGAVSVPVTDTLSFRFYGLHEERDGYILDSTTGFRGASYDRDIGRLRVLWEPSSSFTARLTGTLMRDDNPLSFVTAGRVRAPLGQNVLFANPISPASRAALVFGNTVWDAQYIRPQVSEIRGEQVTLDMRVETPIGEIASLSDYQHSTLDPNFSLDLTRLNWAIGSSPYYEKRYSQELRVANNVGRLSYLAGLYYLHSAVEQGGGRAVNVTQPFASLGPGSVQFDLGGINRVYQPSYTETDAYAVFGQIGYDITDALNLTVGLRWGRDEVSGTAGTILGAIPGFLIPASPIVYREATFNALTGSANLSYEVAPDTLIYASYARGNSPGGLNTGAAAQIPFGPQNVDAFELGLRSQLLDRRVQLNVALFANEYSDLHLTQNRIINGAINPIVTNAGKARGRGIDLDIIADLSEHLRLGVQYTYSDSKITEYDLPPPPAPQLDLTGVPLVRSPEHSLNASLTFTHDIGPGEFSFTVEEAYTSSYTNDYLGEPAGYAYFGIPGVVPPGVTTSQVLDLYRVPGFALTNLSASYEWGDWEISSRVRNLFNKQYISSVLAFDLVTVPLETPGAPRTFEFSLRRRF